ncbi:MAG: hypothetical protein JOS17DRAFT_739105 [Linnemannia elongata]|nr:MAG: hypothetical protein JOS17DRAFT_739105 [Linnemannia elongata]
MSSDSFHSPPDFLGMFLFKVQMTTQSLPSLFFLLNGNNTFLSLFSSLWCVCVAFGHWRPEVNRGAYLSVIITFTPIPKSSLFPWVLFHARSYSRFGLTCVCLCTYLGLPSPFCSLLSFPVL